MAFPVLHLTFSFEFWKKKNFVWKYSSYEQCLSDVECGLSTLKQNAKREFDFLAFNFFCMKFVRHTASLSSELDEEKNRSCMLQRSCLNRSIVS